MDRKTITDAPPVPRIMDRKYPTLPNEAESALANLAASEALPYDHPAQAVLVGRAQAYAALAIAAHG